MVGVDATNGNIWTYGEQRLRAFDRDGNEFLDIESAQYPYWQPNIGMAVDGDAGNIWLLLGTSVHRFDLQGQQTGSFDTQTTYARMALDRSRNTLWVSAENTLRSFNAQFQQSLLLDFTAAPISFIDWDPYRDELWVAAGDKLRRYDDQGQLTFEMSNPLGSINTHFVSPDGVGGVWIGSQTQVYRVDPTGGVSALLTPYSDFTDPTIVDLVANPTDQSVWIANETKLRRFVASGQQLQERELVLADNVQRYVAHLSLFADLTPPTIAFALPENSTFTNNRRPTLRVNYLDPGSGVDTETLSFTVNGAALAVNCTSGATSADCQPTADLPDGLNDFAATVSDEEGNESEPATVSFTVDTANPQITVTSPADNSTSANANITIVGSIDEPATLTIGGQSVTVNGSNAFSHPRTLVEGLNTFALLAVDRAGNPGTLTLRVTLGDAPQPPNLTFIQVFDPGTGTVTVSGAAGSVEPNRLVRLTNPRTGASVVVTATAQGAFSGQIAGIPTDEIQVRAENPAGGQSDPRSISVPGQALPPEAASVAPQLSTVGFTSFSDSVSFLYSGANPIQTGIASGALEVERIAVIRGAVTNRAGQPLSGVQITIQDHPEFGSTRTRVNGQFDIAVNGGGMLAVNYDRVGYFPVQRQISSTWGRFAVVDNVVLVPADSSVTTITLNAASVQTHQGSLVTDDRGTRRATLLVPAGTGATMTLPNGTTQPLPMMNVRASEYTVGSTGLQAMPGELPPTSAYTYAVELSADEAIAAGARRVSFSQPIALYIENFVQFPVGTGVPLAYYDRDRRAWVPEPDGLIIGITAISGGVADIDVRGDGEAASVAELAAIGIDSAERQQLATRYAVGTTLWRSQVRHFSPFDCNWFANDPFDSEKPPESGSDDDARDDTEKEDDECEGCIVKPQSQALGEVLSVVGTNFSLHYSSERARGRNSDSTVVAKLTDDTPRPLLMGMKLTVQVAGRVFTQEYSPAPNVTATFTWDGLDAYGREVTGSVVAWVTASQVYRTVYRFQPGRYEAAIEQARTFGLPPPPMVLTPADEVLYRVPPLNQQRTERTFAQRISGLLPRSGIPQPWSVSIQHMYDSSTGVLYEGTGHVRKSGNVNALVRAWSGTTQAGYAGDGGIAGLARFSDVSAVAVAANGDVYIADRDNFRVRRVRRATQQITTIAGTGMPGSTGDQGLAVNARVEAVNDIALARDGSVYLAEWGSHRVRRIDPMGIITTVAGTGTAGFNGDEQPARDAQLNQPSGVSVAFDGTVFIADSANHRVRRIAPDGTIATVAGTGVAGFGGDGGYAPNAQLNLPTGVAIGPDGALYVADSVNARVRRISVGGTIRTIAGTGTAGFNGDGAVATAAALSNPVAVEVDRFGTIYITDRGNRRIRIVGSAGVITTLAGDGSGSFNDAYPATSSGLQLSGPVAVSPDRTIYLASGTDNRIFRLEPVYLPTTAPAVVTLPSPDAREVFEFDAAGRHLRTIDAFTGATRIAFGYGAAGLAQVTDGSGNITVFERDGTGRLTGIVGPFGQRTSIGLDANGHISSVTYPGGEQHSFEYTPAGLLTRQVDPRGGISEYEYDAAGRLTRDVDAGGGGWTLAAVLGPDGTDVAATTAEGRVTTFRTSGVGVVDTRVRVQRTSYADGTVAETRYASTGEVTVTRSDGTLASTATVPDPRFGMRAPVEAISSLRMPSGSIKSVMRARFAQLGSGSHPLNLVSVTDAVSLSGRTWASVYNAAARTVSTTSPEGRVRVTTEDLLRRPLEAEVPGIAPVTFTYDPQGRITGIQQEADGQSRATTYAYHATGAQRGLLQSVTNSLNQQLSYQYDANGRITRVTFPDARFVQYGYDANGNLTGVTPPGRPQHAFVYSANNLNSAYTPPATGGGTVGTTYEYNLDNQITRALRPDGGAVVYGYLASGKLESVTTPQGSYQYGYNPATGQVSSVIALGSQTLNYAFDGRLLTGQAWSGLVAGSVAFAYNSDFEIASVAVNGDAVTYDFDRDRLVTRAGTLEVTRDVATGFITDTALDRVRTTQTFNAFGELASFTGGNIQPGGIETLIDEMNGLLDDLEGTYIIEELNRADIDDFRVYVADLPDPGAIADLRAELIALRVEAVEEFDNSARNIIDELLGLLDQVEQAQSTFNAQYTFNLTRDALGRITQKVETILGSTATEAYSYDVAGRLTQVMRNGAVIASYSYDPNGNRLSIGGQAASYDDQDRLLSVGSTTYAYTANGELLTRTAGGQTTTYAYDVLGNLLSAQLPDGRTISYVVDGQSRRVGKRINGVLTQGFLYQSQLQIAAELDGSGSVASRFVYGTRPNVPEYMVRTGTTYRVISDHLGSPRLVVNASTGEVVQRIDYDTLGNITADTNPGFQPFGFAGGLYDRDTGLTRFGARDYDGSIGRWTSKDPIAFQAESFNLYGYALLDPLNRIDINGLWSVTASFYRGYGGSITVGRSDGKSFVLVDAGAGLGAGLTFNPDGDFPRPEGTGPADGPEGFIGFQVTLGVKLGPLGLGGNYTGGGYFCKGADGRVKYGFAEGTQSFFRLNNYGVGAIASTGVRLGVAF